MRVLDQFRELGVTPVLKDGRLKLAGQAIKITPYLVNLAKQHKADIVDALKTERIAALDAERHARDRQARRGYDYDSTAPSHAEWSTSSPAYGAVEPKS